MASRCLCKGSGGQASSAAGARKQLRSAGAAEHKAGALECRKARAIVQLGQLRLLGVTAVLHHTTGSSQDGCGFVLHYWDKLTFPNWPAALHCSAGLLSVQLQLHTRLHCWDG